MFGIATQYFCILLLFCDILCISTPTTYMYILSTEAFTNQHHSSARYRPGRLWICLDSSWSSEACSHTIRVIRTRGLP